MRLSLALSVGLLLAPVPAGADDPAPPPPPPGQPAQGQAAEPTLFDPARHMRVAEVEPGMTGYGLSVFKGTKIERFEVEVVSVLRNFNPKTDVVLIRCKGANLEHTGSIAGMSGSPIYLKDKAGKERMVGAFAYGWPMAKDPLAGVQPIEYMLTGGLSKKQLLPAEPKNVAGAEGGEAGGAPGSAGAADAPPASAQPRAVWSIQDAIELWPEDSATPRAGSGASNPFAGGSPARLQPLATPLMAGGLSPKLLDELGPVFSAHGLTPLQAGGGSGVAAPGEAPAKLEPGSVLAVPLMLGDVDMAAIGTVTEVIGSHVVGFGHPFNNEGPVDLPMGAGRINSVIPTLTTSFKLGSLTEQQGRLTFDRSVGISGRVGDKPPMVPIDLRVAYADGTFDKTYHFDSVVHPKFTALLCGAALNAALTGATELPPYNTLDYELKVEFANGKTIDLANKVVNATARELFAAVAMPVMAAADNPFERVLVKKVTGTIRVTPEARESQILNVAVPRAAFRPGETIKAFVTYKTFRGPEGILPVEMELPQNLPQGTYRLVISDSQRYLADEQQSKPFRFTAETTDQLFDALRDFTSVRRDALYLRLVRQADGVAIGRTALPHLPSSRRQVLTGAGRSNTTRYVSSNAKVVTTDMVMGGSAEFAITIDANRKATVTAEPGKPEAAPPGAPAPAPEAQPAEMPDKPAPAPMPTRGEKAFEGAR